MATKSRLPTKPVAGPVAAPPQPVSHYIPLDQLPQPEVIEKDSDSVWALWSEAVDQSSSRGAETQPASLETQPGTLDAQPSTLLMDLPEMPRDD